MLNLFLLYQFIRRLATPFNEWEAYKLGIIDERGNILKPRKTLTTVREKQAFGAYDLMILNLKKLLEKVPGGKSRLASYAAALYLLREWNHFTSDSLLTESTTDTDIQKSVENFQPLIFNLIDVKSIITIDESGVNQKMNDLDKIFEQKFIEDAPTNSAGSGAVAGIGVGPDGEPGLTKAQQKKYKKKNKLKSFKVFHLEQAEMPCPKPTQDLKLNTKNRNAAIKQEHIQYGPLNVDRPGDYWKEIAEFWDTTVDAAKASNCGNCVAFDISKRMKDCLPGDTSDDDGELGYCWMHHFKCHSARSCRTWAKGGPITKDSDSYQWQEKNEGQTQ